MPINGVSGVAFSLPGLGARQFGNLARAAVSAFYGGRQFSIAAFYDGRQINIDWGNPRAMQLGGHPMLRVPAGPPHAWQSVHPPKRHFCYAPDKAQDGVVAKFAKASGLSAQKVSDICQATQGFTFIPLVIVKDPVVAAFLKKFIVDPITATIQQDPMKSTFQHEVVLKLNAASLANEFSNYVMHLAEEGQDGIHIHPYGPRNLVVCAAGDWSMLCTRGSREGEDPANIKDAVEVQFSAGIYIATFPKGRPHGFKSAQPHTVAISIHASDLQEVVDAGLPKDSKDSMALLTRDLGSKDLRIIAKVPVDVVLAMHPPAIDPA